MAQTTEVTETSPPAPQGGNRHLGWALVLICIAQLMVVLDSTIANIALPYIGRDLGIDQANLSLDRHRLRAGLSVASCYSAAGWATSTDGAGSSWSA